MMNVEVTHVYPLQSRALLRDVVGVTRLCTLGAADGGRCTREAANGGRDSRERNTTPRLVIATGVCKLQ